jgi:hypothetical protein
MHYDQKDTPMKSFILLTLLLLPGFTCLQAQQNTFDAASTTEIPVYKVNTAQKHITLNMGYASSEIINRESWDNSRENKIVTEVDLVFTAYPKSKEQWITDYDYLLNKRIEELKKVEPSLSDNKVRWNLILQTQCKSEEEARQMFHGAILKYKFINTLSLSLTPVQKANEGNKLEDYEAAHNEVEEMVYGVSPFHDSIVYKTFNRNNWKNMLIVNDWTGSMYQYGAQAVLWHRLNYDEKAVKNFVFFNDGNEKQDRLKRIGSTGGIYTCKPDSFNYILKVMGLMMRRGSGGDIQENNIEALIKGMRLCKNFDEIVMIADNNAGVRDMRLLEKINVPVRIVLCGVNRCEPIHPHYLEIARKTGGSIHTIEEDITNLSKAREGQMIDILGINYIMKKGKLVRSKYS